MRSVGRSLTILIASTAALGASGLSLSGADTTSSSAAKKNGNIVYADTTREAEAVFSMTPKGNHPQRLAAFDAASGGSPSVSPSGGRIAFERWDVFGNVDFRSEIWVMDANGKHQRRLTQKKGESYRPSFSADNQIAFERHFDIWTMKANGKHERRLLNNADAPYFAADGSAMAFRRKGVIWTLDLKSGRTRSLHLEGFDPAFSPDGDSIVYERNSDLRMARADGKHDRKVRCGDSATACVDPSFSPDGDWILFTSNDGEHGPRVTVMHTDGSHRKVLHSGFAAAWAAR